MAFVSYSTICFHTEKQLPGRWVVLKPSYDFQRHLTIDCQSHPLYIVIPTSNPLYMLTWGLARCCCCTITASLSTRRYDSCNLNFMVIPFHIIRSTGSGRLSNAFNPSGCDLTSSTRLRWRLPKIIFLINRYLFSSVI